MAPPNIRNPNSITGKTKTYINVPTSLTDMFATPVPTGSVYKVNSIFAANRNGSNSSTISIAIYNGSNDAYLAYTITVPADATQIISTKETYFYLEEGWNIKAQSGNANHIDVTISYEELT